MEASTLIRGQAVSLCPKFISCNAIVGGGGNKVRAALGFKMRYSGIRVGDIIRVMVRCLWNGDQISQYGDWIKFQMSSRIMIRVQLQVW